MFTSENTTGYTASELAALNIELAARLGSIDPTDTDAIEDAAKAFSDEIAGR